MDVSRPWGAVPGRKTPFYPDTLHVFDTVFRLFLIQLPSNSSTSQSNDCARVHTGWFQAFGEPYLGERCHFTLTRYTFLTPSSAYSSYNHHPIAPQRGQMTVPGYILDMRRPTFDPPQTTLGCPPSHIPQ